VASIARRRRAKTQTLERARSTLDLKPPRETREPGAVDRTRVFRTSIETGRVDARATARRRDTATPRAMETDAYATPERRRARASEPSTSAARARGKTGHRGAGASPRGRAGVNGSERDARLDDDSAAPMDSGMELRAEDDDDDPLSQIAHEPRVHVGEENAAATAYCAGRRSRGKTFNDPVHGHMYFNPKLCDVIDTPQMQRLRELKQLGTSYYVFPGAGHNRFEHSLGTCHLANTVFESIKRSAPRHGLGLTVEDKLCVQLAGLCHDMGHGPFSHVFDNEFLPLRHGWDPKVVAPWNHERMGVDMFSWCLDDNHIDLEPQVVRRVCDFITSNEEGAKEKRFLFDIIANKQNGIDVDKFEYLLRDSYQAGVRMSVDTMRLTSHMKVIDDRICFKSSEANNVYALFHSRASMHQSVYTHKKAKAVEYMVVDALVEADIAWNGRISNSIWSVEDFIAMDDTLLKQIEFCDDPALAKARDIVRRIRRRELYRFVNEYTVPEDQVVDFKPVEAKDITSCQGTNNIPGGLKPDDIIVQCLKIDYGQKGHKDPVENVRFFHYWDDETSCSIAKEQISSLLPRNFVHRVVRVFSRRREPEYIEATAQAFSNFQRRQLGKEAQITPVKRQRFSNDS
jgi:HD superfamily phosphohydrolase